MAQTCHQRRDLLWWRALGRKDPWAQGWRDFHRGITIGKFTAISEPYRRAQIEAAQLAAACAVTPKGPRAT